METRYRQYKEYDLDAQEAEKEYKQRLKEIPWAPKKEHRSEDYHGNPPMTLAHHQRMAPLAANMVDATRRHIEARSNYDEDYIGHYASKAHRKGHTKKIMQEELSEEELWRRNDDHRRAVHGEDKAAQKEARAERIREKEERRRRMEYERSREDSRW